MGDREVLLKRVQVCCFALNEVGLYLDTHPYDKDALQYYKKHKEMHKQAEKEYTDKYGPLTMMQSQDDAPKWEWVDDPWPWEYKED